MTIKTGFYDRNGREIMKGDSLRLDMSNPPFHTSNFTVNWNEKKSRFVIVPKNFRVDTGFPLKLILDVCIEVIK